MSEGLTLALPGDPQQQTGGYVYDRRIVAELRKAGREARLLSLPETFPRPSAAAEAEAGRRLLAEPASRVLVVDGLSLGALPAVARRVAAARPLVALVHHPLALETGLSAADAAHLARAEREALASVARVIVTSPATVRLLVEDYGVPEGRIAVVEPGTDPADPAEGSPEGEPCRLLTVASLTPRKGHLVMVEALFRLADLDWRWTIVGSAGRDARHAAGIREAIGARGLGPRVDFTGELAGPALDAAYLAADLFVLPSFLEGYGMVLTEALARGLPVVATTAGAIPTTVPAEAGVLVPPGDAEALARALRSLIADRTAREALAAGARTACGRLPRWPDQARRFWQAAMTAARP